MKKVLPFSVRKKTNVIEEIAKELSQMETELVLMSEYYDLEKSSQQKLFRGYSLEKLAKIANIVLPSFMCADLKLEVMELRLLQYAKESVAEGESDAFTRTLGAVRQARVHYVDCIAGKISSAYDRAMRPYRKLGGTPLFHDA